MENNELIEAIQELAPDEELEITEKDGESLGIGEPEIIEEV